MDHKLRFKCSIWMQNNVVIAEEADGNIQIKKE